MKKLLGIILFLGLTFNCHADDLVKVRIDVFEGGQDSFDLADIIQPNQGTSVKNAVISKKGVVSKRKGQSLFCTDDWDTAFTGIGTFYPDQTTSYLLVASGTSIARTGTAGTSWTIVNPFSALTTGKDTEFVQAGNKLIIFNGSNYTAHYTGTAWEEGFSSTASPPTCTTASWLRNYLFCGGNPAQPDWIYFSNNLNPILFTVTDIIKVNTGDGQAIVRLEAFRLNELIVYKEKSIYVLDISGTTPPDDWTVQPISRVIGCVARRSVVSVGNDHIFLSSDPIAVRSLVRSSYDKILVDKISQPIQDIFDGTGDVAINKSYISKACAVLFDDKYFLAIPTGISQVNNTVCIYDISTKSWIVFDGWYVNEWVVFNNNLYYIDANDGRVVQCYGSTYGDLILGPAQTFASEPTVGISWEYASKNIDFGNPENYKQLDAMDVEFDSTGNYNATAYINIDDEGWQSIGTVNLSGNVVTLPVDLPFTLRAGGVARKTFQLQQYGEFKKIKVKFVQAVFNEECGLHSFALFCRIKPWRREQ